LIRKIVAFFIILLQFCIGLTGCIELISEEKKQIKAINLDLESISLNLEDLPDGYINSSEDYYYSQVYDVAIIPIDYYYEYFYYEIPDITYPTIRLILFEFNSSYDAKIVINNLFENAVEDAASFNISNRITPKNTKQVGEESFYELYEKNMLFIKIFDSFIFFRIENIAVGVLLQGNENRELDLIGLTFNYANIIENRIYSSVK